MTRTCFESLLSSILNDASPCSTQKQRLAEVSVSSRKDQKYSQRLAKCDKRAVPDRRKLASPFFFAFPSPSENDHDTVCSPSKCRHGMVSLLIFTFSRSDSSVEKKSEQSQRHHDGAGGRQIGNKQPIPWSAWQVAGLAASTPWNRYFEDFFDWWVDALRFLSIHPWGCFCP
jgi:hypothetical protein